MPLAGRTIEITAHKSLIDRLLEHELDDADRAWLVEHLKPHYPAEAVAAVLRDEGFDISASTIRTWRRKNPNP